MKTTNESIVDLLVEIQELAKGNTQYQQIRDLCYDIVLLLEDAE